MSLRASLPSYPKRAIIREQTICRICSAPARYSYFGAICCSSCKVFFKRHVPLGIEKLTCQFDGQCQINAFNRHICRFCRFRKCLDCGMLPDLVRGKIALPSRTNHRRRQQQQQQKKLHEIPTSNLLQNNHSDLTVEHWNLISTLVRCYDEQNSLKPVEKFMKEQKNLLPKLRYKPSSLQKLFTIVLSGIQSFFELNRDFHSLLSHDRSVLIRSAMENAGTFIGFCVCRQAKFFDDDGMFNLTEKIYGPTFMQNVQRLINEIDHDWTFIKLCVAMFAFSTTNCLAYSNIRMEKINDLRKVLRIQNIYAEVAWRYLLYRYDHRYAVLIFTNYIRCCLLTIATLIESHQIERHRQTVDDLIENLINVS